MSEQIQVHAASRMAELPHVLAVPVELLRAACGHPIVVSMADGAQVVLRLPTVAEFLEQHRRSRAELERMGLDLPPECTAEQIAELVRPLPLGHV